MQIKVLNSNSDGNCIVLKDNDGKMILLDCGISIKLIKEGVNFNIMDLEGAIVSHKHLDHCKAVKDLKYMGVKVFQPYTRADKASRVKCWLGNFQISAFRHEDSEGNMLHTNADGTPCECFGFYITHKNVPDFNLLYVTDTRYCRFKFDNLKNLIIGTNYSMEKLLNSNNNESRIFHTLTGHMSIENTCKMVEVNKPTGNIILSHLSLSNADGDSFMDIVSKVAICPVHIAQKGIVVDLI